MAKYRISEDTGASDIIEADDLEDAMRQAEEWSAGGSYDERVMVNYYVTGLHLSTITLISSVAIIIEAGPLPKEPSCKDDNNHDWQSPYEVVGGLRENPGVWSTGGTAISTEEVCSHCGNYRLTYRTGSQRNSGQLPETISYVDADEVSLAWVQENENE